MRYLFIQFAVHFFLSELSLCAIQAPQHVGETLLTVETFSFNGTPETQFEEFPDCKPNEGWQTPIDLSDCDGVNEDNNARLQLSQEHPERQVILLNAGHYPQVILPPSSRKVYLSFLGIQYLFTNVHFHTGITDKEGSDHTFNGKRYPLEVHVVFRQEHYGSLRDAEMYDGGVLIIGVVYKIGQFNPVIEKVVNHLPQVSEVNATTMIEPYQSKGMVASFLPPDLHSPFYFYNGSLEAPPCMETITWVVYKKPLQLTVDQMRQFRGILKTADGELQWKSWRFTQARNNRDIYSGGHEGH